MPERAAALPLPEQHDPCAPSGDEVFASHQEALANLNRVGADQYLGAVVAPEAARTIGDAVLCGGILASPKIARAHRIAGIRLLADDELKQLKLVAGTGLQTAITALCA